jgi:hypothetical protein
MNVKHRHPLEQDDRPVERRLSYGLTRFGWEIRMDARKPGEPWRASWYFTWAEDEFHHYLEWLGAWGPEATETHCITEVP